MRELVLRVPASAVEDVLDRVLPLAAGGVRETAVPGGEVELRMRGADVPEVDTLARVLAPLPVAIGVGTVPDDWRARRLADYRPDVIGGRLVVRPPWAPPAAAGLIDIVVAETAAFGAGTHPTTRTCLERLLAIPPRGAFADLGCGSGVLSILAARRGWAPVTAVDIQPASIEATVANAAANRVQVGAFVRDLVREPPPEAAGFAANVPADVHLAITSGWPAGAAPGWGLISGIGTDQIGPVLAAYARCDLTERGRHTAHGWVISELVSGERDTTLGRSSTPTPSS